MDYRQNWGEDRVYFHDAEGKMTAIPANCTDASGVDPFVEIAAGRSDFRYEDLLRLAALLAGIREMSEGGV